MFHEVWVEPTMKASILGTYSSVDRAEVAVNVDVPHVGISEILSEIHDTLPLVIRESAALYNLVVVIKYIEGTPEPTQCDTFAYTQFAFCEPVPVTACVPVASTKAEVEAPVATVRAARRLYL